MPVTSNVRIALTALSVESIGDSTMSVHFERPVGFEYEAGDWIDIENAGPALKGGKTYSLSSSPTESELSVTFRTGISPLKRHLQSLTRGDTLYITQYGNDYGFHLRENRSSVLIAGGIGIAPFRSILKDMHDLRSANDVQLIYMNKDDHFVFSTEIETWKTRLNLRVESIVTKELSRKKRHKRLLTSIDMNAHHYFIAGPEGMVEDTEHLLIDAGIGVRDIRIDSFGGY